MSPHRALDVVLELTVLLSSAFVVLVVLQRGCGLLAPTAPLLIGLLVVALTALVVRVRRSAAGESEAGLAPGRWLGAIGPPEVVLVAAFVIVLASMPVSGWSLGADSRQQLEQLRDVLLRGHLTSHPGLEPGVSILWSPFFLLGHLATLFLRLGGADLALDGTSEPYRNALRLGAAAYGLVAAVLAQRACRRFFSSLLAAVAVAGFWLASPLLYYTVHEPAMPHAPGAAVAALVLLLWLRAREAPGQLFRWVALSAAGGLLVSVQRYDAYLLLGPVVSGLVALGAAHRRVTQHPARRTALFASVVVLAFGVAVLPLVLLAAATPGTFLVNPAVTSSMLADWRNPHVAEFLFSSNGGLLAWSPAVLLAFLGMALFAREQRNLVLLILATLALGIYLLSSNPTWWAGWSFGARRMTEAFALLTLGFSAFAAWALRHPRLLGLGALSVLVSVNLLASRSVSRGALPHDDAASFSRAAQTVVGDFYTMVGHPPSWPVNWLFAQRYGVSPDRFDELFGRIPRARWTVRPGAGTERAVLGRGWTAHPRSQEGTPTRWAVGSDATLLFTLPAPQDRRLSFQATGAPHPEGHDQGLVLEVNGHFVGRTRLGPTGRRWHVAVPQAAWRPGLNEVRLTSAWSLTRAEAFIAGVPAFVAWRLEEVTLAPAEP